MAKMTIKKISRYEAMKSVRKDWGELNPVTRVKQSKKGYKRKPKHRKEYA